MIQILLCVVVVVGGGGGSSNSGGGGGVGRLHVTIKTLHTVHFRNFLTFIIS